MTDQCDPVPCVTVPSSTSFVDFFSTYPQVRVDAVTAQADEIIESVMSDVAEIGVVFGTVDDPGLNLLS